MSKGRPLVWLVVGILVAAAYDVALDGGIAPTLFAQEAAKEKLATAQAHEQQLLKRFGPNHPQVRQARQRIELLQRELRRADSLASPQLLELHLEEQRLLEKYGPEHPLLRALRSRIDDLARQSQQPGSWGAAELTRLRTEERHLLKSFGPNHPRVKEVRESLRLLQKQLEQHGHEQPAQLLQLRLEEQRLLRQFGADHPNVKAVQERIRVWEWVQKWQKEPETVEKWLLPDVFPKDPDVDPKKDKERLRELMQLLSENPRLLELHIREQELKRVLGAEHPELKTTRKQIEFLLKQLRRFRPGQPNEAEPKKPPRRSLRIA